jgi:hypothetical protein
VGSRRLDRFSQDNRPASFAIDFSDIIILIKEFAESCGPHQSWLPTLAVISAATNGGSSSNEEDLEYVHCDGNGAFGDGTGICIG